MSTQFVLVDFENVQPRDLASLAGKPVRIKVFVGAAQSKVPFELARALQALGPDAEYIQADGSGSNALDFHIAYYIGRLAAQHPGASFQIISKDTGFDPLIRHLRKHGIECHRSKAIGDGAIGSADVQRPAAPGAQLVARREGAAKSGAPARPDVAAKPRGSRAPAAVATASPGATGADNARVELVIANLAKRKAAKPRTLKTLGSAIRTLFPEGLSDSELAALLEHLKQRRIISEAGGKVSYASHA